MHYNEFSKTGEKPYAEIYQQQLNLFNFAEKEANLYHSNPASRGYFSILQARSNGTVKQRSFPVSELSKVLSTLDLLDGDIWISQAEFWSSCRRLVNLKSLSSSFLDIDGYKSEIGWAFGKSPKAMADAFMFFCDSLEIPRPTVIVFSGRGIQPKWVFEKPIPRKALPRWNALQKELINNFLDYGADPVARDASRVLRVVNTVNRKSGERCRIVGMTLGEDNAPKRYNFEFLCETILPVARESCCKKSSSQNKNDERKISREFDVQSLNWARLEDLRTLLKIRGGIKEGRRALFLMYMMNFLALSHQVNNLSFYDEALQLAKEIDPLWTSRSSDLKTVFSKFKEYQQGKIIEFHGKKYPPLYTPKTKTLIDLFEISPEEQKQMITLINQSEKNRRLRLSRVATGQVMQNRTEYESAAKNKRERAISLRKNGMSIREIARVMNVSKSSIQKYLKNLNTSLLN